jgi:hypothetical protein
MCNSKRDSLIKEMNDHIQNVKNIQKTYEEQSFYMTMIDLSKESALAQIKNNEINNIELKRSTRWSLGISLLALLFSLLSFFSQIFDILPNSNWQKTQTKIQEDLLNTNIELKNSLLQRQVKIDSILIVNKQLNVNILKK